MVDDIILIAEVEGGTNIQWSEGVIQSSTREPSSLYLIYISSKSPFTTSYSPQTSSRAFSRSPALVFREEVQFTLAKCTYREISTLSHGSKIGVQVLSNRPFA